MAGSVSTTSVKTQTSIQAGDTVANSGSATVFATTWTMPANFLTVGRGLRVRSWGVYGSKAALPGNITIDLMAGTTVLATTGAQAATANLTNDAWNLEANVVCITTGAGGTVEAQGMCFLQTGVLIDNPEHMANTATVALDTTASQAIGIRITWGTADPANTITQRLLIVDVLGAQ